MDSGAPAKHRARRRLLALALAAVALGPAYALPAPAWQTEFQSAGQGLTRIESELKLSVPDEDVEPLWQWLDERYRDVSWLDEGDQKFTTTRGVETFTDTYFDDRELHILERKGGVRHRRRVVHSGSAQAKDGRELLQIKLATEDSGGVAREEIKFEVKPPSRIKEPADQHPLIGLIARARRPEVIERFQGLGIDPWALRPVLTVGQFRRRIYVADGAGALATLTLDACTCDDHGVDLAWTEIELELNEIRYTAASPEERLVLEALALRIEREIIDRFPAIQRDQTPKYGKAFYGIDRATYFPLATMHRLHLTVTDLWSVGAIVALAAALCAHHAVRATRRKRLALAA